MQKILILCFALVMCGVNSFAEEKQTDKMVTDTKNGLYWQDDSSSQKSSEDWNDAVLYCDRLVLNDITHWRLPTFKELFSLVDYTRTDPAIDVRFSFVKEGTYWTSTHFSPTRSRAWTIDFRTGKTYYNYTTTNHAVRCVKEIANTSVKDKQ